MSSEFKTLWPGDRLWIIFNVCSEGSEIEDLTAIEKEKFHHISDRIAHWASDIGLPCVSVLKNLEHPDILSGSAMAPFAPINWEELQRTKLFFNQAWSSGITCGHYIDYNNLLPLRESPLGELLQEKYCRCLVHGPERTDFFPEFIRELEDLCSEIWLVSDGVRENIRKNSGRNIKLITFSEIESTRKLTGRLD